MDLKTYVTVGDNQYCVSTVSLIIEHYGGTWFETMIFPSDGFKITEFTNKFCDRYVTEAEAHAGHSKTVSLLEEGKLELYE